MVGASNSRGLCCDMLSTLVSLSHTQKSYSIFSSTHNWHSLTANSCPIRIGSIICSASLYKCMCIDFQSGSASFRACHTYIYTQDIPTSACTRVKQARKWNDDGEMGWMEEAEQVTDIIFSFSLSEVVILSETAISFACLPVFPWGLWRDGEILLWFRTPSSLGQNRPHE